MKRFLLLSLCLAVVGIKGATTSPVSVEWVTPTNGSTVSGTIQLTVRSSSSAAPIQRVEFYRDGVLIATVTNTMLANTPSNLRIIGAR